MSSLLRVTGDVRRSPDSTPAGSARNSPPFRLTGFCLGSILARTEPDHGGRVRRRGGAVHGRTGRERDWAPGGLLRSLAERIEAVERRGASGGSVGGRRAAVPTGWGEVDRLLVADREGGSAASSGKATAGAHSGSVCEPASERSGASGGRRRERCSAPPDHAASGRFDISSSGLPAGGTKKAHGGLRRGALHEWFGQSQGAETSYPLAVLSHLARQALLRSGVVSGAARIVWIGRQCWPYPRALLDGGAGAEERRLLRQSIFIDPPDEASRLWAMDLALRCPAVFGVVADARGLEMSGSRRLQLAAESGGSVGLLARPSAEERSLSVASTRWRVHPVRGPNGRPRWELELMRSREAPSVVAGANRWVVEWSRATGVVAVSADMVNGSGASSAASPPAGAGRALRSA